MSNSKGAVSTKDLCRYFTAGDEISANYVISSPVPLTSFGYAVDASWANGGIDPLVALS